MPREEGRLTHDLAQGKEWRDEALKRVEEHAPEDWKARALDAVWLTAREEGTFTSDEVWLRLHEDDRPHEPRAMGAVMKKAQALGMIAPTGSFRPTKQKNSHASPARVWTYLVSGPYGRKESKD